MTFQKTVALIGAGYWGKNLARNFYELGALHSICDLNESLLDQYQQSYPGVRLSTQFKVVFDDPAIHQVVIAAPAPVHFDIAKQALLADKDVYVEKPICLSVEHAEELVKLAESRNRILMVGHILQYHPCVKKMQEMLAAGQLGKLQYLVSNRLNLGKIQTAENSLWALAPHDVSVILSLCGHRLPQRVRCMGEGYLTPGVADMAMTTLSFEGNVKAHIYVSWLNPFKEQKMVVVGSSAMVVFDDTKPWEEKLMLYRHPVSWQGGNIPKENRTDGELVVVPKAEPLKEECIHFLNCCIDRKAPRTDGKEGVRVLRVLQAAQASLEDEGEVKDPSQSNRSQSECYQAHETAVVDPKAKVGEGCKIWHFSHVMAGAQLGERCNIGQNVVVSPGVVLGNNVKVQNNVSLYTGVICEDDVFLGPSMVFTNIPNPRSAVVRRDKYVNTWVKKGTTIGANATIVCGKTLGEY
jgi:UDP-2-acetamido-3-amino-2,3-dideoxy-glucuronate N-acetyltransferase